MWLKFQDKVIDVSLAVKSIFDPCPLGKEYQRYWMRRYDIFSLFDSGVGLDAEGLFSATPEKIAQDIAQTFKGKTVVDAFCGLGSLSVAFAKVCTHVTAIDIDACRLEKARHNAQVYGVGEKIEFLNKNIFSVLSDIKSDVIFLDPPWGGPQYRNKEIFGLKDFNVNAVLLLEQSFKYFPEVIMLLPRQFETEELKQFGKPYMIKDNYLRSRIYSRTAFFDNLKLKN